MSKVVEFKNYTSMQFYTNEQYLSFLKEIKELEESIEYGEGILDWYSETMTVDEIKYYTALNTNEKQRLEHLKNMLSKIQEAI